MKKIFYLASIAALAFSSCTKDETAEAIVGTAGNGKITAAVGGEDTRAYLDSNQKFRWQANDGLGVYNDATYPMNNDEYVLTEGAESATGIFVGQKKFDAKNHHVAVYPRLDQNLMPSGVTFTEKKVPSAKDAKAYMPNAITVQIPATQKYQPGSFYSKTVPAVSTTFDVNEDGDAAIKMQPVADYLFVNIKSTEPITKLGLKLLDVENDRTEVKLAGAANVAAYNLNGNVRYYLPASNLPASASTAITLETGVYAADLTCHEPNTFVFVIPAGVLGANNQVEAYIWVNKDAPATGFSGYTFAAINGKFATDSAYATNANYSDNTQMNGYWNNQGTTTEKDDVEIIRGLETDDRKWDPNNEDNTAAKGYVTYNMQMENTVFWMNHKDSKGNRTSFTYNPDGAVIIENEGDLLRYLTEYTISDSTSDFYRKDAYICDNHEFDFSIANITNLSDKLKKAGVYEQYEPYFAAYLAGSFPCVPYYINEFNGNGAVISDIAMPLASKNGIFGLLTTSGSGKNQLKATIKDVTFKGIEAATWQWTDLSVFGIGKIKVPGLILGTTANANNYAISNVTVEGAKGLAILDKANVGQYKALTVKDADELNFIVADMTLDADLEVKNWDVVSAAANNVFGALDATGHKVVTLPASAKYTDLAMYTGNNVDLNMNVFQISSMKNGVMYDSSDKSIDAIISAVVGLPYFKVDAINTTDTNAVSVLLGKDLSVWTGDKIAVTTDAANCVNPKATTKVYYVNYAEELANGASTTNVQLKRSMNLSHSNWVMSTFNTINGDGKTVTGVDMDIKLTSNIAGVAPFDADEIKNLIVDGVNIAITTKGSTTVPGVIGGLALDARVIDGVTVNNLVIAGDGEANNDEQYSTSAPVYIGWLVGSAENISVKGSNVNGVNNSIKGVAGLVGKINVTTGATITSSAATNVTKVQSDLTELVDYSALSGWAGANVAGAQVGYVVNSTKTAKSITLSGAGAPAFVFNVTKPGVLNVIYGTAQYDSVQNYY